MSSTAFCIILYLYFYGFIVEEMLNVMNQSKTARFMCSIVFWITWNQSQACLSHHSSHPPHNRWSPFLFPDMAHEVTITYPTIQDYCRSWQATTVHNLAPSQPLIVLGNTVWFKHVYANLHSDEESLLRCRCFWAFASPHGKTVIQSLFPFKPRCHLPSHHNPRWAVSARKRQI